MEEIEVERTASDKVQTAVFVGLNKKKAFCRCVQQEEQQQDQQRYEISSVPDLNITSQ